MLFFPKIKSLKTIYELKLQLRNIKNFIKDILHLIINGSGLSIIFMFIKSFFSKKISNFKREEFYSGKNFDHGDWFTHKIPIFIKNFDDQNKKNILEVLEIGSWEGRSSCFFLKYFDKSSLTCVDTWGGSKENFTDGDPNLKKVESNFDLNLEEFRGKTNKYKLSSDEFFKKNNKKFDFIYIDGSHYYDDVLNDAVNSFNALKENSYILFDDYNWNFHKFGKNPINAINRFLKLYKKKIKIIYISAQVLIKKVN